MAHNAHFSYVFNAGYTFPTLVSLSSLLRQSRGACDVLLLTDRALPAFHMALDHLKQRHPEAQITLIENPDLPGTDHPWAHKVPIQNFWQLYLYDILPCKSLVIDGDTLVVDDAAQAYDTPLGDHAIAAAPDCHYQRLYHSGRYFRRFYPFWQSKRRRIAAHLHENKRDIPMRNYCNTGIVLIDMPKLRSTEKALRLCDLESCLNTKIDKNWSHNDQDWFNFLFAGQIATLPMRWNLQHLLISERKTRKRYLPRRMRVEYREAFVRPGILHFAGGQKPWRPQDEETPLSPFQHQAHMHWRKEAAQLSEETGLDILRLCNDPFAT
ncbi:glycosyltransferase family 8 protein [Celeribacter sp.]|uniref:glycosyltransferase family 8 protein n=1 Tax=Celeribacter sp. TaxID=1890673 RepID=UPI003A9253D7